MKWGNRWLFKDGYDMGDPGSGMGGGDLRGNREDSGEGRDGGEGADREPEEERSREMETGVEEMEGDDGAAA
ncbi:hypothetical protein MRB53_020728 [Persea americana]|uniref:Uncharacterized protein n=1 Tax=Persea americana TaxID=3435 RepID=A0ACC2L202_PERAE|nr:hypothetical protein MRB53_020728 [Persea americana]